MEKTIPNKNLIKEIEFIIENNDAEIAAMKIVNAIHIQKNKIKPDQYRNLIISLLVNLEDIREAEIKNTLS